MAHVWQPAVGEAIADPASFSLMTKTLFPATVRGEDSSTNDECFRCGILLVRRSRARLDPRDVLEDEERDEDERVMTSMEATERFSPASLRSGRLRALR